jgi:hypothetical protein
MAVVCGCDLMLAEAFADQVEAEGAHFADCERRFRAMVSARFA